MPNFKDTEIYRGGLQSSYWTSETRKSNSYQIADVFQNEEFRKQLRIYISISSAGGGTTCLSLYVGHDDLEDMFKMIAKEDPESAALFSECTSIAIKSQNKNECSDDD